MISSLLALAIFCAFDIAAVVIGAIYKNSDVFCVTSLIMFNGAMWLLIGGAVILAVKILAFLALFPLIRDDGFGALQTVSTYSHFVGEILILCTLFMFAWAITDIVFSIQRQCLSCQSSILLCFYWVFLPSITVIVDEFRFNNFFYFCQSQSIVEEVL